MNLTEEELRRLMARAKLADKLSPLEDAYAKKCAALDEIRDLLDDYERQYLTPRNLTFEGMLLPRIASIVRGSPNKPPDPTPTWPRPASERQEDRRGESWRSLPAGASSLRPSPQRV